MKSAFWQIGFIPYNPAVVLEKLCELEEARPVTPLNQPVDNPTLFHTLLTIHTLQRQGDAFLSALLPVKFRLDLQSFIKRSTVQATVRIVAVEELSQTQTAKIARATRQQLSRQSVQKGGVFYFQNARHMVQKRLDKEEMKAERAKKQARTKENDNVLGESI